MGKQYFLSLAMLLVIIIFSSQIILAQSNPDKPTALIQSPGDEGSITTDNTPSFNFTISSSETGITLGYEIQIDNNDDFSSIYRSFHWDGSTTNPNNVEYVVPPGSKLEDDVYYWRVRAWDSTNGLYSDWKDFGSASISDFTVNTFKNDTLNDYDFSGCWGVNLCGVGYACGTFDGVCVEDYLGANSESTCLNDFGSGENHNYKCIDPDCSNTCFNGTVKQIDTEDGIPNAVVSYEMNVWNGTDSTSLRGQTTADEGGYYRLDLNPGNGIYVLADAQGYAPGLAGPYFNMKSNECKELNFTLVNGTCQDDCTKLGSNYCSSSCQNEGSPTGTCLFNENHVFTNDQGQHIPIKSPYEACSEIGVKAGTYADLGSYEKNGVDYCIQVGCCEGTPFETPCPNSDIDSNLKDAIKVTKIAKYKGKNVKIRIYYWK